MILVLLIVAFAVGVAITYWIITPLQWALWRRHDRRAKLARAEAMERRADRLAADWREIADLAKAAR